MSFNAKFSLSYHTRGQTVKEDFLFASRRATPSINPGTERSDKRERVYDRSAHHRDDDRRGDDGE
jgi:hypothetical protein